MKRLLLLLLTIVLIACSVPKKCCAQKTVNIEKLLKFSTFYAAVNGGTSLSDIKVFSSQFSVFRLTTENHVT